MIATNPVQEGEILDLLITNTYDDLSPKVLSYARKQFLKRSKGTFELDGLDPEGLVNEAYMKVAEGLYSKKLRANMGRDELFACLCDAVYGICGNYQRMKGATGVGLVTEPPKDFDPKDGGFDQLSTMINEEEAGALKTRVCVGKNAEDTAKVWEAMVEGFTAQEVAVLLDLDINRVYELTKGIRRGLERVGS